MQANKIFAVMLCFLVLFFLNCLISQQQNCCNSKFFCFGRRFRYCRVQLWLVLMSTNRTLFFSPFCLRLYCGHGLYHLTSAFLMLCTCNMKNMQTRQSRDSSGSTNLCALWPHTSQCFANGEIIHSGKIEACLYYCICTYFYKGKKIGRLFFILKVARNGNVFYYYSCHKCSLRSLV